MNIEKVTEDFILSLEARRGFLSEDNIRFYWFDSMKAQDSDLNHFSLEEPYADKNDKITGRNKELDLLYENENEQWCIEIKFHRNPQKTQKSQTFAVTQSAGEIFDDICRLPLWESTSIKVKDKPTRYFFLYVTDDEMHRYLSNETGHYKNIEYRKELAKFYAIKENGEYQCKFNDSAPKVFKEQATASLKKKMLDVPKLVIRTSRDIMCPSTSLKIPQGKSIPNCHIRLYEILPTSK